MKVSTGIPGFDRVLGGGFETGTTNLISGEPGTCKSIICMSFLYYRAKKHKERCVYVTTEDGIESIYRQAGEFGMNFKDPEVRKYLQVIRLEPYNINKIMGIIDMIRRKKIIRVVFDSMSVFEAYVRDPILVRKSLFNVIEQLRTYCGGDGVTLMTAEIPVGSKRLSRFGMMEFMSDSITKMQYIQEAKVKRSLIVKKKRFSGHSENAHPFRITKKGIIVR